MTVFVAGCEPGLLSTRETDEPPVMALTPPTAPAVVNTAPPDIDEPEDPGHEIEMNDPSAKADGPNIAIEPGAPPEPTESSTPDETSASTTPPDSPTDENDGDGTETVDEDEVAAVEEPAVLPRGTCQFDYFPGDDLVANHEAHDSTPPNSAPSIPAGHDAYDHRTDRVWPTAHAEPE
ncbi:MAG: hypothetical protein VX589_14025, partial [Myxococcota bacterium]|nr:hypothetical protein [Myxococcota bacterium]